MFAVYGDSEIMDTPWSANLSLIGDHGSRFVRRNRVQIFPWPHEKPWRGGKAWS